MIPLWMTAMRPWQSTWGWAFRSVGPPPPSRALLRQRGAHRRGDRVGVLERVVLVRRLDHDPDDRFGPGSPDQHPPPLSQDLLRLTHRLPHLIGIAEPLGVRHLHVQ